VLLKIKTGAGGNARVKCEGIRMKKKGKGCLDEKKNSEAKFNGIT
jgi:hypothetical protein